MNQDEIIQKLVGNPSRKIEEIVQKSFMKHFGFPLFKVRDIENLERLITEGSPISSYRYRGETFLYVMEPVIETGPHTEPSLTQFRVIIWYKMV